MERFDFILIGAGLANSLAAIRLNELGKSFRLIEKRSDVGASQTWSFHLSDVSEEDRRWLDPFVSKFWDSQHVRFPKYERELDIGYASIRGSDFYPKLRKTLGEKFVEAEVVEFGDGSVTLGDGTQWQADCIVDGMGWGETDVNLAYQKFVGHTVTFEKPHGLKSPRIMDATVEQIDGYRFVYVLPYNENSALIEDTYYSDGPELDVEAIRERISTYAKEQGWTIRKLEEEETGVLPLPLEGELPQWDPGVIANGMRGGFFHPTTGYSFPFAVRMANKIAEGTTPSECHDYAKSVWGSVGFYRLLNRWLFRAARPALRYQVLQHFYRAPQAIVEDFYAAKLSLFGKGRMLFGKPPVSMYRAFQHLFPKPVGAV